MKCFLSILTLSIFLLTACVPAVEFAENESTETDEKESRIAFVSQRDGQSDIYSMNPDGSDVTQITNDAAIDTYPVWSPDRSQLAYASYVESDFDIERSRFL